MWKQGSIFANVFFNKKLSEGVSSKSFLILVKIMVFLVPKVSYSVSNHFLIITFILAFMRIKVGVSSAKGRKSRN